MYRGVRITTERKMTQIRMISRAFNMDSLLASASIPKQMPARLEAMMLKGRERNRAIHVIAMIMAGPKGEEVGSYTSNSRSRTKETRKQKMLR